VKQQCSVPAPYSGGSGPHIHMETAILTGGLQVFTGGTAMLWRVLSLQRASFNFPECSRNHCPATSCHTSLHAARRPRLITINNKNTEQNNGLANEEIQFDPGESSQRPHLLFLKYTFQQHLPNYNHVFQAISYFTFYSQNVCIFLLSHT
jgi:hypothetical protein